MSFCFDRCVHLQRAGVRSGPEVGRWLFLWLRVCGCHFWTLPVHREVSPVSFSRLPFWHWFSLAANSVEKSLTCSTVPNPLAGQGWWVRPLFLMFADHWNGFFFLHYWIVERDFDPFDCIGSKLRLASGFLGLRGLPAVLWQCMKQNEKTLFDLRELKHRLTDKKKKMTWKTHHRTNICNKLTTHQWILTSCQQTVDTVTDCLSHKT